MLARTLACHVVGRARTKPAAAIAAEVYGNDPTLLQALAAPGMVGKAATGPAMTSDGPWAGVLVTAGNADFFQVLTPNSIYSQLSQHPGAIRVSLAGRASIKVPSRTPSPTLASTFVGEGGAIAVRQLALSTASLAPRKASMISMFSEETMKYSQPNIEAVVRATLAYDVAISIDGALLDANPQSVIRPAGILNGVTPTTATAGGGLAAFGGDVRALAAAIETTGPLIAPVLIMSTTSAMLLGSQLLGANDMPIIASPTVPAKQLIMLDAANFASAEGDTPDISSSREVSYHAEDTLPLPIVGGTAQPPTLAQIAAPVMSAFQTATIAIRLIQDCSWIMTRSGRVSVITTVSW
jgi:hypothetical protein